MRASYRVVATRKSDGLILAEEIATDHYEQGMGTVANAIREKLIATHTDANGLSYDDIDIAMSAFS